MALRANLDEYMVAYIENYLLADMASLEAFRLLPVQQRRGRLGTLSFSVSLPE